MQRIHHVLLGLMMSLSLSSIAVAEEARGVERMGEGTVDAITSPGQIVEGVSSETEDKGAAGVVTGTAKGTVDAAGQAAQGAVDVGRGAVETVLDPLTND
jgi:hypothetical protein